ncbi:hypothetical protein CPARA_2gp206 (nucleomorph) [Cryptomonas paramecium]|uniref:Uncharacterized protein n=1 Tax=Cryptomonas paramaecium TaxID=2898 RepID=F2HHR8_9CRYP|nr:hypothetical protein CPARA_2gp206 [Cryptomonas paramecium]AEA38864.1 hypothetical protein CPARA_2gp206 [Cryptomonas paramecium]
MTSFLCNLDPGLSTSFITCVIPALYPINAVICVFSKVFSAGKDFITPFFFLHRFLGKKPNEPCLGASNFL